MSDGTTLAEVEFVFDASDGGAGGWRPVHVHAREAMSKLYEYSFVLANVHTDAALEDLFDKAVKVDIVRDSVTRSLSGFVRRVEDLGTTGGYTFGRITVVPQLWKLSQRKDSRIFQEVNIITIIREVFKEANVYQGEAGLVVGGNLESSLPPREYCVQYQETDLDFVLRLLQEEGVPFYFKHDGAQETLVFAEDQHPYEEVPTLDGGAVTIRDAGINTASAETVQWFDWHHKTHSTGIVIRDYDFTHPRAILDGTARAPGDPGARHPYEYPARYDFGEYDEGQHAYKPHFGARAARVRNEEIRHDARTGHGRANVSGFMPGRRFALQGHLRAEHDHPWVILGVIHEGVAWGDIPDEVRTSDHVRAVLKSVGGEALDIATGGGHETAAQSRYFNKFLCIPADVQFRPPRDIPRPLVYGSQTARVMALPGSDDEICVDFHGRILVRFHWERTENRTPSQRSKMSSCWIRVSTSWGGAAWGAIFIPRVGMEVVVTFLEGDPDRPLVTGCVYNGENNTPYLLPDEKTKSTIKTSSSPGSNGFNELRFEDLANNEQIYMHAQRDFDTMVRHDSTLTIGNDRTKTVMGHERKTIKKNRTVLVEENDYVETNGNRNLTVHGSEGTAWQVDNNFVVNADKSLKLTVGDSSIEMLPDKITIASKTVHVLGTSLVNIDGKLVTINCGNNPGGAKKSGLEMFATQAMELQGTPGGVLERIKQALDAGKLAETLSKSADKLLTKLGLPAGVRERLTGLVKGVGAELISAVKEGRKPNFGKIINEEQITGLVKSGVDSVFGPLAEKVKNNKVLSGLVKEAQGVVTTAATWGTLHAAGINTGLAKDPLWSVLKQRHGESVRNFLAENANAAAKQVLDRFVQKHGNTPFLQKVEKQLLKGAEKGIQKGLDRILGPRPN